MSVMLLGELHYKTVCNYMENDVRKLNDADDNINLTFDRCFLNSYVGESLAEGVREFVQELIRMNTETWNNRYEYTDEEIKLDELTCDPPPVPLKVFYVAMKSIRYQIEDFYLDDRGSYANNVALECLNAVIGLAAQKILGNTRTLDGVDGWEIC